MHRLFETARPVLAPDGKTLALPVIWHLSPLEADDRPLGGDDLTRIANNTLLTAVDHVFALQILREARSGSTVGTWTALRCALETCAAAAWVICPKLRKVRQARALRLWRADYLEREGWHQDHGQQKEAEAARKRYDELKTLGEVLELVQVGKNASGRLIVAEAASEAGLDGIAVRALWREASAFAHGRNWSVELSRPSERGPTSGKNHYQTFDIDEDQAQRTAAVIQQLLSRALSDFEQRARPAHTQGPPRIHERK